MKTFDITLITPEEIKALELFDSGRKHSCSTSIDEDTIVAGYGKLDYGGFEFPLPDFKVIELYGTLSWNEYLNKSIKKKEYVPIEFTKEAIIKHLESLIEFNDDLKISVFDIENLIKDIKLSK